MNQHWHEIGRIGKDRPRRSRQSNMIAIGGVQGSACNTYATTRNIVAAYQMIQPTARSHRHTPAALRLVLNTADDVYTVVDGMRVEMTPGDVVLTPSWCWHGHANEGNQAAFLLDFLDVPFVRHLETTFFEPDPEAFQRLFANTTAERTLMAPTIFETVQMQRR